MDERMQRIFIIGFMGTGKSAISKELGQITNYKVVDTDKLIETEMNISITRIFEEKGEKYFRSLETEILEKVANLDKCIISCGGGLPIKTENQDIMKNTGKVVLLKATAETVFNRVKNNTDRPLLAEDMTIEHIQKLMEERSAAYEKAADISIYTDNKSISVICQELIDRFNGGKERRW